MDYIQTDAIINVSELLQLYILFIALYLFWNYLLHILSFVILMCLSHIHADTNQAKTKACLNTWNVSFTVWQLRGTISQSGEHFLIPKLLNNIPYEHA